MSAEIKPPKLRSPWAVVIGCGIVAACGATLWWSAALPLLIKPLEQAYGWSRADIAFAFTLMTLATPLLAPLAGALIDRVNLRRLVLVSIVLQSLAVAAFSLMSARLLTLYGLCLALAVVCYGASLLSLSKIVQGWFDRERGRALGVLFACASVGPIVHPLLAQAMLASFGLQQMFLVAGAASLVMTGSAAWLLVHVRPDTGPGSSAAAPLDKALTAPPASMQQLLRSRAFWALALWGALFVFGLGSITLHLPSLLQDRGGTPAQSAAAYSLIGVGLLLGNLGIATLLDKVSVRALASAVMLGPLAAVGILTMADLNASPFVGQAAAVLLGLATGGEGTMLAYLVGSYFAAGLYARAYAAQTVALALAGGMGPWCAGLMYGAYGDYNRVLALSAAMFIAAALAAWALPAQARESTRIRR